jgi:putative hydrolase of the HAD superfamily
MFPFDVILFDVGGVLLTNGWDSGERATVLAQFGLDRAEFEARHRAPYLEWERGAIPMQNYLRETVFYQPRSFSQEEFFSAICAGSKLLPRGAMGILREVVASDKYVVGALNNEARETNAYRFEQFGLKGLFQVALSSCFLGLRKPDAEIYERSIDILCRPAQRILFIDDREENVLAAQAAGMKAIRFDGADPMRQQLESLGVL